MEPRYYGHARQVAAALWGLGLITTGKYVFITDSDVDVTDPSKVMAAALIDATWPWDCETRGGACAIHPSVRRHRN